MAPSEVLELSRTALMVRCKVCGGSEEEDKRFLICDHSGCLYKYYHISCLTTEQVASDVQMGSQHWYCPSCLCRVCLCDTDDDQIILCDGCDEGYHLYCLSPPKRKVPKGNWDCDPCKERSEKEKRILMLHRRDYDAEVLKSVELDGLNLLLKAAKKVKGSHSKKKVKGSQCKKKVEGDAEVEVTTTTGK